jgi:hypothetical protein
MCRVALLLLLVSCERIPCEEIPDSFESYAQAHRIVKSASFEFKDDQNTAKSSWIRSAAYYSCDGQSGFLVIRTDNGEYFHQNVPMSVWNRLKTADSFGKFWHTNIKGRYNLRLKN